MVYRRKEIRAKEPEVKSVNWGLIKAVRLNERSLSLK